MGYGVEETFRVALDRFEGQILKSKELAHDRESAKEYLRKLSDDTTLEVQGKLTKTDDVSNELSRSYGEYIKSSFPFEYEKKTYS